MFIQGTAHSERRTALALAFLLGCLSACGASPATSPNAALQDVATLPATDTTPGESDTSEDALERDTQAPSQDATEPSAATPWALSHPCDDTASEVYQTPEGALGDDVALGTVVRCTHDPWLDAESVATRAAPFGISTQRGIEMLRIAYRTERGDHGPGVGTATVLLPSPRPQGPLSVMMLAHGSIGLADFCAPSKDTDTITEMALPFAGNDMVVVAPDYAGLGNEGVQGYRDNRDTTYSALDAVRAVYQLVSPDQLTGDYAAIGHSQGGGVVIYSQALSATYLPEVPFIGGVAFAPGWTPSGTPSTQLYTSPHLFPTSFNGGAPVALSSLFLYADAANHVDPESPGLYFHADYRAEIVSQIESGCVFALAGYFKGLVGVSAEDILDPAFLTGCKSCLSDEPTCTEPYLGHIERFKSQHLTPDAEGAPVLMILGLKDPLLTPQRAACHLQGMAQVGFEPQVCVDLSANHMNIVPNQLPFAAAWINALIEGATVEACATSADALPPCAAP